MAPKSKFRASILFSILSCQLSCVKEVPEEGERCGYPDHGRPSPMQGFKEGMHHPLEGVESGYGRKRHGSHRQLPSARVRMHEDVLVPIAGKAVSLLTTDDT